MCEPVKIVTNQNNIINIWHKLHGSRIAVNNVVIKWAQNFIASDTSLDHVTRRDLPLCIFLERWDKSGSFPRPLLAVPYTGTQVLSSGPAAESSKTNEGRYWHLKLTRKHWQISVFCNNEKISTEKSNENNSNVSTSFCHGVQFHFHCIFIQF